MRPRPFLLLLAGFALVLMAAGEADAEKEPEWNYTTDGWDDVMIGARKPNSENLQTARPGDSNPQPPPCDYVIFQKRGFNPRRNR